MGKTAEDLVLHPVVTDELCKKHDTKENQVGKLYFHRREKEGEDWSDTKLGCFCSECIKESGKEDELWNDIVKLVESYGFKNLLESNKK